MQPDYARTLNKLSIDFAASPISHARTLSIVALAECARGTLTSVDEGNNVPAVSSWCPADMDTTTVEAGLGWQPFWTEMRCSATALSFDWSAAGSLPISEYSLHYDGVIGEVDSVGSRVMISILLNLESKIIAVGPIAGSSLSEVL
jgi:hypothetical protein